MDLVTYPCLPLSTKIFNFTEYIPRTWWETIGSVFKFNYWFQLSLNPPASSASLLQEWKKGNREKRLWEGICKAALSALPLIKMPHLRAGLDWNLTTTVVSCARPPTVSDELPSSIFAEIPLRSTARRSFLVQLCTEPRQSEMCHILAPTICTPLSHTHTHTFCTIKSLWVSLIKRRVSMLSSLWILLNP